LDNSTVIYDAFAVINLYGDVSKRIFANYATLKGIRTPATAMPNIMHILESRLHYRGKPRMHIGRILAPELRIASKYIRRKQENA